jgi:hypothetical protein
MDCETVTPDPGDDRRDLVFFFWRFRKWQHVVLAVLRNTVMPRVLLIPFCLTDLDYPTRRRSSLGNLSHPFGPRTSAVRCSLTPQRRRAPTKTGLLGNQATNLQVSSGYPGDRGQSEVNSASQRRNHLLFAAHNLVPGCTGTHRLGLLVVLPEKLLGNLRIVQSRRLLQTVAEEVGRLTTEGKCQK